MPRSKGFNRRIISKTKAAASEGEAFEALEDTIVELSAERSGCATTYEFAENDAAVSAAYEDLESLRGKAARKESERIGYIYHAPRAVAAAPLTKREREAKAEAERSAEARAAELRAAAVERVRRGNPALGIKGVDETDPRFETRVSQVIVQLKKELDEMRVKASEVSGPEGGAGAAATVAAAATVTIDAGGWKQASTVSKADEAGSWRRSGSAAVAAAVAATTTATAAAEPSSARKYDPSVRSAGLPRELDALLSNYPVCYKAMADGSSREVRYMIEIHRKKLRDLCVREGRNINEKEVETSLLPALRETGLCAIGSGGWGSICIIAV